MKHDYRTGAKSSFAPYVGMQVSTILFQYTSGPKLLIYKRNTHTIMVHENTVLLLKFALLK